SIYPNENYDFYYVLTSYKDLDENECKDIDMTFSSGEYDFYVEECYEAPIEYFEKCVNSVNEYKIIEKTTNSLTGIVDMQEDGYFNITIPYDKNFIMTVDGEITSIEHTDSAFMGCKLSKGKHIIQFTYSIPFLKVSEAISLTGILMFVVLWLGELKIKIKKRKGVDKK
ncbi:MAG: YfhO family protein, partial [Eubacterium sp.]